MNEWTDDELRSAVSAYLSMMVKQDRSESFSKAAVRRRLREGELKARPEASIEYRMQNISAVLEQHGRGTLKGYLAAKNVGDAVSGRIWTMIREADGLPMNVVIPAGRLERAK